MAEATKERAQRLGGKIKDDLDALEALHPAGSETGDLVRRLHRRLNRVAHWTAEHFDDGVSTFSGGTDKPPPAQEEDDDEKD